MINSMSAMCRICSHPNRKQIDEALLGKTSRQKIADQYGVSVRSVGRHLANHLNGALAPKALKPWERRPGERPRQWDAFEAYLKLCTENQDRDVSYAELARSQGLSPETVRSWAWRYKWKERVDAWLLEITRSRLKRLRAEAERSRERWRHLGREMQNLGAKRLAKIDADKLSPEEARRLVMEGAALEARGLESVIREFGQSGRTQQNNIAVIIQAPTLERLEERHRSRLLEIKAEKISDDENQ